MAGIDAESEKARIVAENVGKMNGEMMGLLMSESIGGNAGEVDVAGKRYPAAGANALVDRMTGQIVAFGNGLSSGRKEIDVPIILRVAFDKWNDNGFFHVTKIHHATNNPSKLRPAHVLDSHAVDVLQRSVNQWNAEHEGEVTEK